MHKQLLLLAFLSLAILAQDQVLAVSGDGSSSYTVEDGSNIIITDLPTASSLIPGASPQGCSNWDSTNLICLQCKLGWSLNANKGCTIASSKMQIAPLTPSVPSAPSNFNFLNQNSLGNNSKWVIANQESSFGIFSLTTFTITYTTFCPNQVILLIAASNIFRVFQNAILVQGWSFPWLNVYMISLTPSCQCNTITVQVFNFWYQSPAAIIYSLTQNTNGCFNCEMESQFWNYKTCSCECKRNCCPKGMFLLNKSCQCIRIIYSVGALHLNASKIGSR